ncbi:MAG: hypothetical protein HY560_05870 [Gemmatimonadetes bacterium]|nr:hypothetical protein [Gemmatimonadota bacterium]
MSNLNASRLLAGGLVGTAAMTVLMLMAPLMGMPPMPIGEMLGQFLGIGTAAGWAMHGVIGLVLATIYAALVAARLPGPTALRGAIYGFAVFLVAQIVVTPMMGGGVFSGGNVPMIMGSLIGHLVYGALVGAIYGLPPEAAPSAAHRPA